MGQEKRAKVEKMLSDFRGTERWEKAINTLDKYAILTDQPIKPSSGLDLIDISTIKNPFNQPEKIRL